MNLPNNPKQAALYSLIASLVVSGLIGIVTLLIGSFDQLQVKVLLTSLTISGGSILALACGAAVEKGVDTSLARSGFILACVATILVLVGIWTDPSADEYWRLTGSACVLSTALALNSLLGLATVAPRFAWIRRASKISIAALAVLLVLLIWLEPREDVFFRLIGIASIIVTVLTVVTPVLHYITAHEQPTITPPGEQHAQTQSGTSHTDKHATVNPRQGVHTDVVPSVINVRDKLSHIDGFWKPHVVAELNGQSVKLAKIKGVFDFHHHEHEDEFFMVVEGEMRIEFRSGSITLGPGEATVVPRGVDHRPIAESETHILLFEPSTTVNTGNVDNDRTIRDLPRI